MEIKATLVLTPRGRERTALGWEQITIIDFGYDQDGKLSEVVCAAEGPKGQSGSGPYRIFTIGGYDDIFEDLFQNYDVARTSLVKY